MSYFGNRENRPFQLLEGFKFKAPAYVISYWETGIDTSFLRNEAFKSKPAMQKRIREIKNPDGFGTGIYSALRWRYMGASATWYRNRKPKPRFPTITESAIRRLAFCNSKKLPRRVVHEGLVKEWVGIGWVTLDGEKPKPADVRVVEDGC